ncbi:MAG: winged helix-turn-helix transcriptional regulator [Halanaerobiales bacterium]
MPQISARVSENLYEQIEQEAKDKGKNKSQLIRDCIKEKIKISDQNNNLKEEIECLRDRVNDIEMEVTNNSKVSEVLNNNNNGSMDSKIPEIDDKDRKILYHASKGIHSYSELSELVGVSQNTVYRRFKKLEEENILKDKITAIPNYNKIRVSFIIISMKVPPNSREKAISYLEQRNEVKFLWNGYGDFDIASVVMSFENKIDETILKLKEDLEKQNIEVKNFKQLISSKLRKLDFSPI